MLGTIFQRSPDTFDLPATVGPPLINVDKLTLAAPSCIRYPSDVEVTVSYKKRKAVRLQVITSSRRIEINLF